MILYDSVANMQRVLAVTFALVLIMGIVGAAHYYIWARLVRDVGWPPYARRCFTAILIALCLSIPASFILSRQLPPNHGRWILFVTYTWMGSVLTLLIVLATADLLRFVVELWNAPNFGPESPPERRQFLKRALAAGAALVTSSSTALSIKEALADVQVKTVHVQLARLPAAMHGFTIVEISICTWAPHFGLSLCGESCRKSIDWMPT